MPQATSDRKIEIMRSILFIFNSAQQQGIDPRQLRLPIDTAPCPTTTLEPHIKECLFERQHRSNALERLSGATLEFSRVQIRVLNEIIEILRTIEGTYTPPPQQTSLFL